jgi:hypothetical protein
MKKKEIIIIATLLLLLLATVPSLAEETWEMNIAVGVHKAGNRLAIGQRPDATDGKDGLYDVRAFLSGYIQSYLNLNGEPYWRDIRGACRAPCEKTWDITVESALVGETVALSWDPSLLPAGMSIILINTATGETVDMKKARRHEYENTGSEEFAVRVTW